MKIITRTSLLLSLVLPSPLLVTSCGDDAAEHDDHTTDAGAPPSPIAKTKLPRPALARPPHAGLPAELRPPR